MSVAAEARMARRDKRLRTMITPEGVALPLSLASRGSRAGALVVDLVILSVTTIAVAIIFDALGAGASKDMAYSANQEAASFLDIFFALMVFIAWNGYFMFFEMGPRGATPGKRMMGIRVAARGGDRLTPEAVLTRNLVRDIELFVPFNIVFRSSLLFGWGAAQWAALMVFLVFMLFPFFNKDRLRAGDLIAGTWVLDAPKMKLAGTLSTSGSVATHTSDITGTQYRFGEEELSVYGEHELQTLERVLREGRPQALEAVADTICRKIGWNPGAGDERAFLEAFYAQLRVRLESDMRFGKRKADKYS